MKNFILTYINNWKRLKKRNKIIIILIIILIIMRFVPVKFAVKPEGIDKDREHYILEYIHGDTTDSGWWIVGSWNNDIKQNYVRVKGKVPSDYLINSISHEYGNRYVVYGSLEYRYENYYGNDYLTSTLTIDSWNILSDIHGGSHKKYLTIYDLNWLPWLSEKTEKWRADK